MIDTVASATAASSEKRRIPTLYQRIRINPARCDPDGRSGGEGEDADQADVDGSQAQVR